MKYIIMCGGKYLSFADFRPLIKVNGEPLVERTIKILRQLGIDDIAVSTNEEIDLLDYLDVPVIKFKNSYAARGYNNFTGYWCDAFYRTDEPVCYLMGDTYYSTDALKQIVGAETDDILFFGTDAPFAQGYTKRYSEPLAFKVVNQQKFQEACDTFRKLQDLGPSRWPFCRLPIAWELAQIISRYPVNRVIVQTPIFVGVHYFTGDIDNPEEAEELRETIERYNIQ